MTAKPQPMAGQSDAADDLIAELAKLMAQDAQGERAPARPAFSLRIPGGDTPTPPTANEFVRSPATSPSEPAPAPVVPAAPRPIEASETPAPFHFDFDLNTPKRVEAEAVRVPAPAPVVAAPAPVAAAPAPADEDHDSIADLIAAEFDQHIAANAPAEPPAVVASEQRQPPQTSAGWAPTPVAASLGAQDKPAPAPLRALNLQPAPRAEQDRFKVPPVFGLGSPAAAAPAVAPVVSAPVVAAPTPVEPVFTARQPVPEVPVASAPSSQDDGLGRDPIDEIENLIGRAMSVEFDTPVEPVAEPRPTVSPALRSLATPTVPSAPPLEAAPSRPLSGADEAILAAARASGAQIGWVEAPEVSEIDPVAAAPKRRPRALGMTRAIAGPLVAVTLLLAAGFGLYWVLGLGGESGPAPLLTADASPIKETPVVQPDAAAAQQSVVFNEIDGVVPGAEEQLLSRDQADVNEVTQIPPTELSEEGLANRKVRTVTVRPDGTIVSADDSVAGSAILPVARPNVPTVPGAETASPELLATAAADASTPAAATPAETATPTPEPAAAPAVTPVTPGSTVPAVDLAGNPLPGKTAPVPMIRPAGLAALAAAMPATPVTAVVSTPVTSGGNTLPPPPTTSLLSSTPAATPVATPAPAAVTAAQPSASVPGAVEVDALPNNAPAYVQLASQRSEEEARATAQAMVTRFGPLFGGANMEVQRVDLGAKGIYYRVRVPANSLQDANNICTNVKAAGGDCFTM